MRLSKDVESLTMVEWSLLEGIRFTKRQIECLWRYYWIGEKQREIACDLGITGPMVSMHLTAARHKIALHFGLSTE